MLNNTEVIESILVKIRVKIYCYLILMKAHKLFQVIDSVQIIKSGFTWQNNNYYYNYVLKIIAPLPCHRAVKIIFNLPKDIPWVKVRTILKLIFKMYRDDLPSCMSFHITKSQLSQNSIIKQKYHEVFYIRQRGNFVESFTG